MEGKRLGKNVATKQTRRGESVHTGAAGDNPMRKKKRNRSTDSRDEKAESRGGGTELRKLAFPGIHCRQSRKLKTVEPLGKAGGRCGVAAKMAKPKKKRNATEKAKPNQGILRTHNTGKGSRPKSKKKDLNSARPHAVRAGAQSTAFRPRR